MIAPTFSRTCSAPSPTTSAISNAKGRAASGRGSGSIVRSKAADHFASWRRHQGAAGGTEAYQRLLEVPDAVEASASALLMPTEEILVLRQAMAIVQAEFEPKTWEAASRTIIDGRSAPEVAKELGMTPIAVRKAKSRVLQRLRSEMEGLLD